MPTVPPNTGGVNTNLVPVWSTPGHWTGATGQPIPDPPTKVTYNANAAPTLGADHYRANLDPALWDRIRNWLIAYGGASAQDGPKLSKLKAPYSAGDRGFLADLYAHTVTVQPRGGEFNPSTGGAIAGPGPINIPGISSVLDFLRLLANPGLWVRIVEGALGLILISVGLSTIVGRQVGPAIPMLTKVIKP